MRKESWSVINFYLLWHEAAISTDGEPQSPTFLWPCSVKSQFLADFDYVLLFLLPTFLLHIIPLSSSSSSLSPYPPSRIRSILHYFLPSKSILHFDLKDKSILCLTATLWRRTRFSRWSSVHSRPECSVSWPDCSTPKNKTSYPLNTPGVRETEKKKHCPCTE